MSPVTLPSSLSSPPLPPPSLPCSLNSLPGRAQFDQHPFLADAGLFVQLNEPTCLCNRGLLIKRQPRRRRGREGRVEGRGGGRGEWRRGSRECEGGEVKARSIFCSGHPTIKYLQSITCDEMHVTHEISCGNDCVPTQLSPVDG